MIFVGSKIKFTRGDDDALLVALKNGVTFKEGDKVYFCLKADPTTMDDIFQIESTAFFPYKEVENAAALVTITHDHTIDLEPGDYYYDIWVAWANDTVVTVVHPTKFTLVPGGSHDDAI